MKNWKMWSPKKGEQLSCTVRSPSQTPQLSGEKEGSSFSPVTSMRWSWKAALPSWSSMAWSLRTAGIIPAALDTRSPQVLYTCKVRWNLGMLLFCCLNFLQKSLAVTAQTCHRCKRLKLHSFLPWFQWRYKHLHSGWGWINVYKIK